MTSSADRPVLLSPVIVRDYASAHSLETVSATLHRCARYAKI
jgi:hypothetical protein